MANITHSLSGGGAPVAAPPSLNAHYLDTLTGTHYLAKGTTAPEDWEAMAKQSDVPIIPTIPEYVAGANISIDATDPNAPIISALANSSKPIANITTLSGSDLLEGWKGKLYYYEGYASSRILTIQSQAAGGYADDWEAEFCITQTSEVSIEPAIGVTLLIPEGKLAKIKGQGKWLKLKKLQDNVWVVIGDLESASLAGVKGMYNVYSSEGINPADSATKICVVQSSGVVLYIGTDASKFWDGAAQAEIYNAGNYTSAVDGDGATLRIPQGKTATIAQYGRAIVTRIGANTWQISGDLVSA